MSDDQARLIVHYDILQDAVFARLDVQVREGDHIFVCSPPISIQALNLPGGKEKASAKIRDVVAQLEAEMAKHMKKNGVRLGDVIVPEAPASYLLPQWAEIGRPIRIAL